MPWTPTSSKSCVAGSTGLSPSFLPFPFSFVSCSLWCPVPFVPSKVGFGIRLPHRSTTDDRTPTVDRKSQVPVEVDSVRTRMSLERWTRNLWKDCVTKMELSS